MRKLFFCIAAAAALLTACNKANEIKVDTDILTVPAEGGVYKVNLTCNTKWEVDILGDANVTVEPDMGEGNAEVTFTFAENLAEKPVAAVITFSCGIAPNNLMAQVAANQAQLTSVSWGGVDYPVKKMKDGNYWFTQNLRYVPEGKEVSLDLSAVDNGVWYPADYVTKTLTDNPDTVAKKGYLYSAEAALGLPAGTVNDENCLSYEGAQGICPPGWHIPTLDEIAHLVGRVSMSKYDLNGNPGPVSTAPYWSVEDATAKISTANADGFNISHASCFINVSATGTKGTVINTMNYILSSTAYFRFTEDKPEGFFNKQFYAIQPAIAGSSKPYGGSCIGGTFNYRGGAFVRCIKDHKNVNNPL